MLDIVKIGDEILREKTEKIEVFDDALRLLVDAMFETLDEAEGVGLAAPQVGVSKSIFVISIPDENIRKVFINPVITGTSEREEYHDEGCLSIPGQFWSVKRFSSVSVQAQDENGRPFTVKAEGLYSRAIQHEFDHLQGRLYVDRLSDKDKATVLARYEKEKNRKATRRRR